MKESKASLLSTSHQATSLHFIMVLPWYEIIASCMANLKEKFECSSCCSKFNQNEQASLFTIITSLKYKFVLHLLKGYLHYKTLFCKKVALDV